MSDDRPYFSELHLRCDTCGCHWTDWHPNNCLIEVWLAAVEALRCPKCGAGPKGISIPGGLEGELEASRTR